MWQNRFASRYLCLAAVLYKKYHQDCINTPSIKKRTQPKDSHMSEPPHHRITKRAGHKRKKGAEFALHNGELTSFVHFASNTKLELA